MSFSKRCNKRLQREVVDLLNKSAPENSSCGVCFELPDEEDITKLTAYLQGPQDTPYQNGIFALSVEFPSDYPISPPKIKFDTRIWHPNISSVTGAVCLNTLSKDWTPSLSVFACVLSIRALLSEPAPDDPQDAMVASQFKNNYPVYVATARYWTSEFASKHEKYQHLKKNECDFANNNPEIEKLLSEYKLRHEKIANFKISRTRSLEALSLENWNLIGAMSQLNIKFRDSQELPMIRPSASSSRKRKNTTTTKKKEKSPPKKSKRK